jgi:hypothetical protein
MGESVPTLFKYLSVNGNATSGLAIVILGNNDSFPMDNHLPRQAEGQQNKAEGQ